MALELKDRIYTECIGTGTGKIEIGDTKEAYQGWDSLDNGANTYYCIVDDTSWEVGHGVYTITNGLQEITRNLLASSTGSLLDLSGVSSIFCTYPAEKSVYLDLNNNIDLPNSDAVLKYIAGIQVTSPAVITEAVIVDGKAGADGDLAGLLNVYRKDEIDDQQEVQDIQIEKNKQDIVELEEEIEALAPSSDRGKWDYKEPSDPTNIPAEGNYFILDADGNSTADFSNAHEILFNNKDVNDITHTWATVEVGQKIEMFDEIDSEFLLAKIEDITLESGVAKFEVTVEQSEGGAGGGSPRVRVKIFQIDVDTSTLMPKSGGTFTGGVRISWKKDGYLTEALTVTDNHDNKALSIWSDGSVHTANKNFGDTDFVTKEYVDSKTNPTAVTCEQFWTNASWNTDNMVDALVGHIKVHEDRTALVLNKNGSDTSILKDWESELAPYPSYFGIKIDDEIYFVEVEFLGRGGSNDRGYNFKILSHNLPENVEEESLVGICPSFTPTPLTTTLYSLSSTLTKPLTFKYPKSLGADEFALISNNPSEVKHVYLYKLYDNHGNEEQVYNYSITPATEIEIREFDTGYLLYTGLVSEMNVSPEASGDRVLHIPTPSYAKNGYIFSGNKKYAIKLTNLTKNKDD